MSSAEVVQVENKINPATIAQLQHEPHFSDEQNQLTIDILTKLNQEKPDSFRFQFAYLCRQVLHLSSVIAEVIPQSKKQFQDMIEEHDRSLRETNFDAIRTTVNQMKTAAEQTKVLLETQVPEIKESILKETQSLVSEESAKLEAVRKAQEAEQRFIDIEKKSLTLKKQGYFFASVAGVGAVCSVLFLASILFMFFYGKHILTGEQLVLGEYPISKMEFRRMDGKLCIRVPQKNPCAPVWFYEKGYAGDQGRVWAKYVEVDTGESN